MTVFTNADAIVDELQALYEQSVATLRAALTAYIENGETPTLDTRDEGAFAYPEIHLRYKGDSDRPTPPRSFARLTTPGHYAISVTRPAMFRDYLVEQLSLLTVDYNVEISVERGRQEIPFPYVLD